MKCYVLVMPLLLRGQHISEMRSETFIVVVVVSRESKSHNEKNTVET